MKNMIRTDMTACRGVPLNLCALRQAFVSVFLLLKYNCLLYTSDAADD